MHFRKALSFILSDKSIIMKKSIPLRISTLILILFQPVSFSEATEGPGSKIFMSTRVGMMQSVDLPGAGELHFNLGHRFGSIQGGLYEFFGLDLATIRLGFDYGITDNIAVGIGRSTFEKTYDLFTKAVIARQSADGFPLAITGDIAASFNTLRNTYPAGNDGMWDRASFCVQLIIARKLGRFSFQTAPLYFRNNYETRSQQDLNLFALPLTGSFKFAKRFALTSQYIPVFNKPDFVSVNPFSIGIDIETGGHQFQLIFANSNGLFDKSVLTNSDGSWKTGKIYFGFNLVRVFYLKNKE